MNTLEQPKSHLQEEIERARQKFLNTGHRVQRLPAQESKAFWGIRPNKRRNKILG
ncbi:MAG: hypothetical protein OEV94_00860 [Deltaproteobacteria bacterium]|nr:hypothetical protein [Deltaproteobacteria bacterium]